MSPEQGKEFLEALGAKNPQQHGDWLRSSCVLAPWLHKSGKDSNPSFGLSVREGESSHFHCFSCRSGGLDTLLQTLEFLQQTSPRNLLMDIQRAREIASDDSAKVYPLPQYSEFGVASKHFEALPEWLLQSFLPAVHSPRAIEYLVHRGFDESDALKFDLRYDTGRDMLVFPYRDVHGRFAGMRGRAVDHDHAVGYRHHDYEWQDLNNSQFVWWNEPCLQLPGPVVVCEGQMDGMRVARVYPKVVANLTAKPIPGKIKKLQYADAAILLNDNDEAGRIANQKYIQQLGEQMLVAIPEFPDGVKDPDAAGEDWIRSVLRELQVID